MNGGQYQAIGDYGSQAVRDSSYSHAGRRIDRRAGFYSEYRTRLSRIGSVVQKPDTQTEGMKSKLSRSTLFTHGMSLSNKYK